MNQDLLRLLADRAFDGYLEDDYRTPPVYRSLKLSFLMARILILCAGRFPLAACEQNLLFCCRTASMMPFRFRVYDFPKIHTFTSSRGLELIRCIILRVSNGIFPIVNVKAWLFPNQFPKLTLERLSEDLHLIICWRSICIKREEAEFCSSYPWF